MLIAGAGLTVLLFRFLFDDERRECLRSRTRKRLGIYNPWRLVIAEALFAALTAGGMRVVMSATHENTEPVTREVEYGLLRSALGPLLLLLGLVSLADLVVVRQQGLIHVSDGDRTAMAFAEERDEFDDWISQEPVSRTATYRPTIYIDTLEDLVDVALATHSRVIEDAETGNYYILTEANCYQYDPPRHIPA